MVNVCINTRTGPVVQRNVCNSSRIDMSRKAVGPPRVFLAVVPRISPIHWRAERPPDNLQPVTLRGQDQQAGQSLTRPTSP
jgi:hypothetical protein